MLTRMATERLMHAASASPAVLVMGARGVGKSSIVSELPSKQPRLSLRMDDPELRADAADSPDEFLTQAPFLALDEIQRAPKLLTAMARLLDDPAQRQPGRFVMTSSANLFRIRRVTDTLAGSAIYTTLWPLTRREILGFGEAGAWGELERTPPSGWVDFLLRSNAPHEDWRAMSQRGGYPQIATVPTTTQSSMNWRQDYIESYLDRDLPQLSSIDNLAEFLRLMKVTCRNLGRVVNKTEWGREASVPPTTVDRFLNLLETSYQLIRVGAYDEPCGKRLITSPKAYWSDTGLAMHLSGESSPRRAHLENIVLTDLVAWRAAHSPRTRIMHWRTTVGSDVSFVLEFADGSVLGIQVSDGAEPTVSELVSIKLFITEYRAAVRGGLLLHTGSASGMLAENLASVPWWSII
ncbi:MAG: ATP-binding protein [Anaerolineae bacterium]|nr:ATP-binding protein [Gemmatimonadaceae bacterium]